MKMSGPHSNLRMVATAGVLLSLHVAAIEFFMRNTRKPHKPDDRQMPRQLCRPERAAQTTTTP